VIEDVRMQDPERDADIFMRLCVDVFLQDVVHQLEDVWTCTLTCALRSGRSCSSSLRSRRGFVLTLQFRHIADRQPILSEQAEQMGESSGGFVLDMVPGAIPRCVLAHLKERDDLAEVRVADFCAGHDANFIFAC
jgi:hypothetical protein